MMRTYTAVILLATLVAGCDNAGEGLGLPVLPEGTIGVGLYFDRDGSQTQTAGDTVFAGARVSLRIMSAVRRFGAALRWARK